MKCTLPLVLFSVVLTGCLEQAGESSPGGTAAGSRPTTSRPSAQPTSRPSPASDKPASKPVSDKPASDKPASDKPASDEPASKPVSDKPASDEPASDEPASAKPAAAARLDESKYDHFGAGVAAEGETLDLAALASKADELAGKKIRLAGRIEAVCKKKGCWMRLSDGEHKVHVKFADYGFFVPTDADGRDAVLVGTFEVSKTSVADLKHLLEDEGKHEEAAKITEPRLEMKVTADGVALAK